jgi:hypothetical protein
MKEMRKTGNVKKRLILLGMSLFSVKLEARTSTEIKKIY